MERLEGRTSVLAAARRRGVAVKEASSDELDSLAQAKSHGGVIALAGPKPLLSADELYKKVEASALAPFLSLIEGADDVRNLGYLLRTAEAMGVQAVLVRRRAWDVDATALSRSSSGAYERLPVVLIDRDLAAISELKKRRLRLIGCIPRARDAIYSVDLKAPIILAIGGEKRGLSGAVRSLCDRLACIPTVGGASSLSMTQAGAIVLAEAARQRRG